MTQLVCWVAFPPVLLILSLGCGLLLERAAGFELPEPLVLPAGLAVIIVAAETADEARARRQTSPRRRSSSLALLGPRARETVAATAATRSLAAAHRARGLRGLPGARPAHRRADLHRLHQARRHRHLDGDDRLGPQPRARPLGAPAVDVSRATSRLYLNGGEPVGALLPWGIGHRLVGQDLAWVFQPYLALLGAMVSLSLWPIVGPLIRSRPLRARSCSSPRSRR